LSGPAEYFHERKTIINTFNNVLDQGIIDEHEDEDYGIPIPSLNTWLVDEYTKDKENLL